MPAAPEVPTDPVAVAHRAELLCHLDRAAEAVPLLHHALTSYPDDPDLWRHLSYAQAQLHQYPDALAAAKRAVRIDPEDEWGHRLVSLMQSKLGRYAAAADAAREAVRLDPHNWQGHVRLALALAQLVGYERGAWRAAVTAVELAPNEPDAHNTVGVLALASEDYERAEEAFRRMLELEPGNANGIYNLALVDRERGRLGLAAARFGDAVAADPRMHDGALAVDDSLLELLRRLLWLTMLTCLALAGLSLVGRHVLGVGLVVATGLLASGVWAAYRQIPVRMRSYLLRLARRHPAGATAAALWLLTVGAFVAGSVLVWWGWVGGFDLLRLAAVVAVAQILLTIELRRLRARMTRPR